MSLRLRLLLAAGAVAVVALVVADVVTYSALRSFLYGQIDRNMQQSQGAVLAPMASATTGCGGPGGGHGAGRGFAPGAVPEFVEIRSGGGVVQCRDPAHVGQRAYYPDLSGRHPVPSVGSPVYFDVRASTAGGPGFRVREALLRGGGELVLAVPLSDTGDTLRRLLSIELLVTAGAVLVAAVSGWWLVRLGLRPLTAMEETAEAIATGRLAERVPVASERTEVGRLGGSLNRMLERIQSAFAARDHTEAQLRASERRLRQFIGDASHELRTPIAAVAAYAELFERGASEDEADLGRVMTGIRVEAARMQRLVGDLLLLARIDEGQPLEHDAVELVSLCGEAVDVARAVGAAWPIQLRAAHPVELVADPLRLRQVVDNLLANVRAHTPPGTATTVEVSSSGSRAELTVRDDGPGMAPEVAERVFERFYRADPSRCASTGERAWGSPSSPPSSPLTVAPWPPVRRRARARPSSSGCRSSRPRTAWARRPAKCRWRRCRDGRLSIRGSPITTWDESHCHAGTVDGITLYDLG